ncbi:hypothetical protein [Prescottella equi]|uniref:hypothetical protein n=1 Tax=Rhodococcus hoagii TaxID=43767 RepID=UPI0027411EE2|nr:hypothetical protein [Prescottella equi]MDP8017668.1 hypothetical protein [Prescottella equi]
MTEIGYRAVAYPSSAGVQIQEMSAEGTVVRQIAWIEATDDSQDPLEWITQALEKATWAATGALRSLPADDVNSIEDGWTVRVSRSMFAAYPPEDIELRVVETELDHLATRLPLVAEHREALIDVVRNDYRHNDAHADPDGVSECISIEDGDLVWCSGGGLYFRFTALRLPTGDFVRAGTRTERGWTTDADWPVDHDNHRATARTIWQLINLAAGS